MAMSQRFAVSLLAHLLLLFSSVLATSFRHNTTLSAHDQDDLSRLYPRQEAEKPFYLRIMPLGASITAGYGTNPENGYRKPLRDQLRWEGWPVNMIGSQSNGDPEKFKDRQHEGHPGWVVANMTKAAKMSIDMKPNLILLNCGTNDANPDNHQNVTDTANRMEALLNFLYDQVDGVTIILSTLIPYLEDVPNFNVDIINAGYRDLYERLRDDGKKIGLAELNNGFLDTSTDYFDQIHPNEKGAAKLAAVWDQAIAEVEAAGFLSNPIDTGVSDESNSGCDVERGQGRGPIRTQQGSGEDDGPYYQSDQYGTSNLAPNGFFSIGTKVSFAQLVNLGGADPGSEFDELVYCYDESDSDGNKSPGNCVFIINNGGDLSGQEVYVDVGLKCLTRGQRWGDVNADGLDDFICIGPDGNIYVAINRGGNPPKFEPLENGGLIREGFSWAPQNRIRLGDIDGDGRLDYCAIDDKGDIYCWRNGGVGDAPTKTYNGYWQSFVVGEPTFYAQHEAEGIEGVNLVDINGDGRSDWVYLHKDSSSTIFINQRGDNDADGKSLRPHWEPAARGHTAIEAFRKDKPTHNISELVFGRVKGSGRADLIWNIDTPGKNKGDLPFIAPFLIENISYSGGTKLKGDGVFYCDMFGRGRDDYLWVKSDGHITLFENILSPPNWGQHGEIIFIDRDRKSIHFGDWDGDGLCDILAVERHTGRVEWWRNTYKQGDKSPTFDGPEWAVDQGQCNLGWGRGLYDQALRFGDLDGDGRVDYLCMEKDARTVGYLNKPSGLESKGQIKFAPAGPLDRANFKWADVDGDGRVDLIWVDKFTAEARVWKNDGFTPSGGSSMTWIDQGIRFDGHGRGQNIHFPSLGGLGRADYHDVYPATAVANTWFNECSGGDDYPEPMNPHLPTPSGSLPPRSVPDPQLVQEAQGAYPGIWWDIAATTCSADEFETLVEATRQSIKVVQQMDENEITGSSGWDQFFFNTADWFPGGQYFNVTKNMLNVVMPTIRNFAMAIPRKDRQAFKITYRCGDVGVHLNCRRSNGIAGGATAAYVANATCGDNTCKSIQFCSRFFRRPGLGAAYQPLHIETILDEGAHFPNEFADLLTFERTMIHEWMHARGDSLNGRVIDVKDYPTNNAPNMTIIYGSDYAYKYAHKFEPSANPKTAINADNFALMYTWNTFAKYWGWDTRLKTRELKASWVEAWKNGTDSLDHPEIPDDQANGVDIEMTKIKSPDGACPVGTDGLNHCGYMGGDFYAASGCYLTVECTVPADDGGIDPDCTCTCDGEKVDLADPRCCDFRRDPLG